MNITLAEKRIILKWLDKYIETESNFGVPFFLLPYEIMVKQKIEFNAFDTDYDESDAEIIKSWMNKSLYSSAFSNPTIFGDEEPLILKLNEQLGIKVDYQNPIKFTSWSLDDNKPRKQRKFKEILKGFFNKSL